MSGSDITKFSLVNGPMADYITRERITIFLRNIGINNTNEFGRCYYSSSTSGPIGNHYHEDSYEICYHITGSQNYCVGNEYFKTNGGEIFITFPNEIHSTGAFFEEKSKFYYFSFNLTPSTRNFLGLDDESTDYIRNSMQNIRVRKFRGIDCLKGIHDSIMSIYFSTLPIKKSRIQYLLLEYFLAIIDSAEKSKAIKNKNYPSDIQKVLDYIDSNILKHHHIKDLAKNISLSESRFEQKFKQYVGVTPYDYVIRRKMEIASDMLTRTSIDVTQIAVDLDFSSSQYFSTVFKRYYGLTPSEYRILKKSSYCR